MCAHFCYKMVHCRILFWCIVGFVKLVNCSIACEGRIWVNRLHESAQNLWYKHNKTKHNKNKNYVDIVTITIYMILLWGSRLTDNYFMAFLDCHAWTTFWQTGAILGIGQMYYLGNCLLWPFSAIVCFIEHVHALKKKMPNVAILMKCSSLAALKVVKTFTAASDENLIKMIQCDLCFAMSHFGTGIFTHIL